jgi:hypothetical protein
VALHAVPDDRMPFALPHLGVLPRRGVLYRSAALRPGLPVARRSCVVDTSASRERGGNVFVGEKYIGLRLGLGLATLQVFGSVYVDMSLRKERSGKGEVSIKQWDVCCCSRVVGAEDRQWKRFHSSACAEGVRRSSLWLCGEHGLVAAPVRSVGTGV